MFSQVQMVKAKKALETMYVGKCIVTEYRKVKKENLSTGFEEVIVLENVPCRLSSSSIGQSSDGNTSGISQVIKVFLSPDIEIKPGSKMTISQNNKVVDYKSSGQPAFYATHQEIVLELFKGWA